jgi:mannose-6-phosphate isomerase-like protein (cupin superfamily)
MTQELQYTVKMEPRFAALELIDVGAVAEAVTEQWYNETLCEVDDHLVRIGVLHGEYHWHSHQGQDEFFYVVEGKLQIELDRHPTVELSSRQGFTVPHDLRHRPIAPERTVVLMIEKAGVVPTGDG